MFGQIDLCQCISLNTHTHTQSAGAGGPRSLRVHHAGRHATKKKQFALTLNLLATTFPYDAAEKHELPRWNAFGQNG